MADYAWADYRAKVTRSLAHRKKYAPDKVLGDKTTEELETYLNARLTVIDEYVDEAAKVSLKGADAETATGEILDAIGDNNFGMRSLFRDEDEILNGLEPVAHKKKKSSTSGTDKSKDT